MRIPQMSHDDQKSSSPTKERGEQRDQFTPLLDPRGSQTSFTSNDSRRSRAAGSTTQSTHSQPETASHAAASQYYQAQARQPINDAVTSAINNTESPLSPELLSQLTNQITQSVLQQLKAHPLPMPAVPPAPSFTSEPFETASSMEGSPPLDRAKVYTPPSPYRAAEEAAQTHTSPRLQARAGQPVYGEASPPRRDLSPFSQDSRAGEPEAKDDKPSRPPGPKRLSTGGDTTVLEKIWGKLFDREGRPTQRLGCFLRGIAVHLIEDYEPKHSLVITPAKMQKYYEDTKVTNDIYPWQIVFDDRTSSISRLLRELGVQHHLVQEDGVFDQRPDLPGLTPHGFETWATLVLRAHPDQEFERLAKTALDMPINNPDDMKERFPKELSRRQFPNNDEPQVAARLQKAMAAHCNVHIASRNSSNAEPDPRPSQATPRPTDSGRPPPAPPNAASFPDRLDPHNQPGSAPPGRTSFSNLERTASAPPEKLSPQTSSTSKGPTDSAIEEEESGTVTPHPIERERKPYVANPGGGKNFDVESHSADEKTTEIMPGAPEEPKLRRSTSVSTKPKTNPIAIHQNGEVPPDFPDLQRARTQPSQYHKDPPAPRGGRNRSPSRDHGDYRRPEAEEKYGSSYHSTSSHDGYRPTYSDRYAHRAQSIYPPDTREREYNERQSRPRFQSMSVADSNYYATTGHEYGSGPIPVPSHSSANGNLYSSSASSHPHYPPNSYRDGR